MCRLCFIYNSVNVSQSTGPHIFHLPVFIPQVLHCAAVTHPSTNIILYCLSSLIDIMIFPYTLSLIHFETDMLQIFHIQINTNNFYQAFNCRNLPSFRGKMLYFKYTLLNIKIVCTLTTKILLDIKSSDITGVVAIYLGAYYYSCELYPCLQFSSSPKTRQKAVNHKRNFPESMGIFLGYRHT